MIKDIGFYCSIYVFNRRNKVGKGIIDKLLESKK